MKRNVIRRKPLEPKSGTDAEPDPRDGGVQSVDRALSIIETLAEDDEGYRLSDLAVRTGLSTSTVHRLLATLEKRRFVHFDRYESKWHVGAQSFSVGATFARRRNFAAQAMPYLRKLRDQTRETANLAVVDDESIIVLARIESREIMRSLTKVGGRVAMVAFNRSTARSRSSRRSPKTTRDTASLTLPSAPACRHRRSIACWRRWKSAALFISTVTNPSGMSARRASL